ncbi:Protein of unknown function [Pyronema omphalodes CBS 100304]|uniref:Uncharacterized protein n=1 Tax=Pyronema omphalodes (strain CBS 100304) TaxID=1076935 RepID=U4LVD6_PYROM|nr:Protein of unknown function [Pyronema omphalodes CBS 100304]
MLIPHFTPEHRQSIILSKHHRRVRLLLPNYEAF